MGSIDIYHYTDCGLEDVFLRNGFEVKETSYGTAIAIHNIDQLHEVIGRYIATNKPALTGAELRYLRLELDLPQKDLATILGVCESTIRNWEKNRVQEIPGPADRMVRLLYLEKIDGQSQIGELIARLSKLNRDQYHTTLEVVESEQGWQMAA